MEHREIIRLEREKTRETLERISRAGGLETFLKKEGVELTEAFVSLRRLIELNGGPKGIFRIGCIDEGIQKFCGLAAPGIGRINNQFLAKTVESIIATCRSELIGYFQDEQFVRRKDFWEMFEITGHHDCGAARGEFERKSATTAETAAVDQYADRQAREATASASQILKNKYGEAAEIDYVYIGQPQENEAAAPNEKLNRPEGFHPAGIIYVDFTGKFVRHAPAGMPPGFTISAKHIPDLDDAPADQIIGEQIKTAANIAFNPAGHGIGQPGRIVFFCNEDSASAAAKAREGFEKQMKETGWGRGIKFEEIKIAV